MKRIYILSIYLSAIIGMAIITGCSHDLSFEEPEFDVNVAFEISDIEFAADGMVIKPLDPKINKDNGVYLSFSPTFDNYEFRIEYPEWMEVRSGSNFSGLLANGNCMPQNRYSEGFLAICKTNNSVNQREGKFTITVRNTAPSELYHIKYGEEVPVYTFTKTVKVIQLGATTE